MKVLVHLACYVAGLADVQAGIRHLKHRVDIRACLCGHILVLPNIKRHTPLFLSFPEFVH